MFKRISVCVLLTAAFFAGAAVTTPVYQFPIWNGTAYIYAKLGPSLTVANGYLDAVTPAAASARTYDALLTYNPATGGWALPVGAKNVAIHCNGLRYRAGLDYSITAGVVKSLSDNMDSTYQVTADFDK